jgi:hypothetical protein
VPTNQELGLFLEVFETHAHTSSLVSAGGHCPFGKMYAEASLARLSQITRFRFRLAMAGLCRWRPVRDPEPGELDSPTNYLERQVELHNPEVLIFSGGLSACYREMRLQPEGP